MKLALAISVALMAGILPVAVRAQSGPTDPQIVGIVETANQIDIDYGKLALSKTKNKEVHDFAQQMITDHTAVQKSVTDLASKLGVKPASSETGDSLKKQASETTANLKKLNGAAFDKAYIDNEVAYHKAVIGAVSNTLIPNAKNAQLKSALTSTAPLFQGHLEHAEHLQSTLK